MLWAIAEPADARKLNAALATAILGVPGEALHRMQSDEGELEPWLERFARWNQLWHERGFVQMAQRCSTRRRCSRGCSRAATASGA